MLKVHEVQMLRSSLGLITFQMSSRTIDHQIKTVLWDVLVCSFWQDHHTTHHKKMFSSAVNVQHQVWLYLKSNINNKEIVLQKKKLNNTLRLASNKKTKMFYNKLVC